jgi:hypothetical protein
MAELLGRGSRVLLQFEALLLLDAQCNAARGRLLKATL